MQTIQQVFSNPLYFLGLREIASLPSMVIVVDKDRVHFPLADYTSIQEAINGSKTGDTILVFPGLYEEQLTIPHGLQIYGNGAFVNPIPNGRAGGEAIVSNKYTVSVDAGNVIFSGFELVNFETAIQVGDNAFQAPDYAASSITLSYNWIHGTEAWVGINAQGGYLKDYTICNSIIDVDNIPKTAHPYALAAINFSQHSTQTILPKYENIIIRNNVLRNNSGQFDLFAGAPSERYTIDHMVIECNHFISRIDATAVDGASFNIGNIANGRFESNIVEHAPGSIGMQSGSIKGNSFIHGGSLKLWGTEYPFTRPTRDVDIINNEFTNEEFGNGLHVRAGVASDTLNVRYNAFLDANISPNSVLDPSRGYAIRNDTTMALDTTVNWWGTPAGPDGNHSKAYGACITAPWVKKYQEEPECMEKRERLCWPLSMFRSRRPGFYPCIITGITYIGDTCFKPSECVELAMLVQFVGGNGKNIPVDVSIDGCHYHSCTMIGGYALVKVGCLCRGSHTVCMKAEDVAGTTTIYVKCNCEK